MAFFSRSKTTNKKQVSRTSKNMREDLNARRDTLESQYHLDDLSIEYLANNEMSVPYDRDFDRQLRERRRPTSYDIQSYIEEDKPHSESFEGAEAEVNQRDSRHSFGYVRQPTKPIFRHLATSVEPLSDLARLAADYRRDVRGTNPNYDKDVNDDADYFPYVSDEVANRSTTTSTHKLLQVTDTRSLSPNPETVLERDNSNSWGLKLVEHLPFLALIGIAFLSVLQVAQNSPLSMSEAQIWYNSLFPSENVANTGMFTGSSTLFNLVIGQIISIFGDTPLILRSLSLAFYLASIVLMYSFGTRLITRDVGLVLASLFAFSKFSFLGAAQLDVAILLSFLVLSLIISAIYVHATKSRIIIFLAMLTSISILNLTPFGLAIVAAIFVGAFFDAASNMRTQFLRFSGWGLGQGIAILIFLPWSLKGANFDYLSWLTRGEAISNSPDRFGEIASVLSFHYSAMIPIALGIVLALRTLFLPTPLNTGKPVMIGGLLFLPTLLPALITFLMAPDGNSGVNMDLLAATFSVLILLSGIGLAFLSTRVPFHGSFFVALFVLIGFTNVPPATLTGVDRQSAIEHYTASGDTNGCLVIFPKQQLFQTLYGIQKKPDCVVTSDTEEDVTPQSIKNESGTIFFFPKPQGDGTSLRKILQNFPQSAWQIQPQPFNGVLVIKLTRK